MVGLQPMPDESFAVWNPRVWASYRDGLVLSGLTEAAADENIARNVATVMPNGVLVEGHHVFDVCADGETVGAVWLADRGTEWFIYDIEIDADHRGRGLGRQAMQSVETFVREQGGRAIGLSVFGFNKTAQQLYLSEGYETTHVSMLKRLD